MKKKNKLLNKFINSKGPFTWKEITIILNILGFKQLEAEGSRVHFYKDNMNIVLHRPHPQNEVKQYVIRQLKASLKREHLL